MRMESQPDKEGDLHVCVDASRNCVCMHTPKQICFQRKMKRLCKFKVRLHDRQMLSGRDMKALFSSFTPLSKNQRPIIHFLMLTKSNVQSFKNVREKIHYTSHYIYSILAVSRLFGQIYPFKLQYFCYMYLINQPCNSCNSWLHELIHLKTQYAIQFYGLVVGKHCSTLQILKTLAQGIVFWTLRININLNYLKRKFSPW